MSNIVPLRGGTMPTVFAGKTLPDMNHNAQQGLLASFAVIGFKGRNWRIKFRGDDEMIKDDRNQPAQTLDVVIVGVSKAISKQWYDKKYSDGDNEAPDCFSVNGINPDPASPKKQCDACAVCPQNIFGSRITEAGKKAKACADTRRLAVVPTGDIENETYGGPMLLRLPPTSLSRLASYGNELSRFGAQPYMVRTTLGFDWDVAYPLITFSPTGWLDDATAAQVAEALDNPLIERILETEVVEATHDPAAETSSLAGGAPAQAFQAAPAAATQAAPAAAQAAPAQATQAAPKKAAAPKPEPVAQATPEPVAQAAPEVAGAADESEDEEAALLAKMQALKARKAAQAAAKAMPTATTVAAPAATTAAAPPKKAGSAFAGKSAAPQAGAPAAAPAANGALAGGTGGVTPAPSDLESAIDALLSA